MGPWRLDTGWSSLCGTSRLERSSVCGCKVKDFLVLCLEQHISARAQEFILTEACRADARVALLEVAFVGAVLHAGRQWAVPRIGRPVRPDESHHARTRQSTEEIARSCQDLDDVPMEDVFLQRIPMLKKSPVLAWEIARSFRVWPPGAFEGQNGR